MALDATLAYLHYISIMLVAGFLTGEFYLLRSGLDAIRLRLLARADIIYFIAAIIALLSGLGRAFWGIKPWEFYAASPWFHAKMTLYVAISILSLIPTFRFIRWRKASMQDASFIPSDAEQRLVRKVIMWELHLLALIPLTAVLMTRGIKMF